MITQASEGQILTKEEAMTQLTDINGKPIKWKEQKDGTLTYETSVKGTKDKSGKEIGGSKYSYSVTPNSQNVRVSVQKTRVPYGKEKDEDTGEQKAGLLADEEMQASTRTTYGKSEGQGEKFKQADTRTTTEKEKDSNTTTRKYNKR